MFRTFAITALLGPFWFTSFIVTGCGGSSHSAAPESPPDAPRESLGDSDSSADDVSAEEEALLAQIEAEAGAADAEAAAASESGDDGKREVVYRVTQDGMKIEVLGAEFFPQVEPVRVAGGWGLKLTVEATSEAELVLFSPKTGPLAFGGKIKREKTERFGDRREGGAEVKLSPGKRVAFSRSWPEEGEQPLQVGDELELHVGLWGLGFDSSDRRPLNRFVVVRMMPDTSGAQPVIQPPGQ